MSISPQWALIHSVTQKGPEGLHYILGRGIVPEHLGDEHSEPKKVLEFMLGYISSERLPTHDEIKLATKISIPLYTGPLDVELCANVVIDGALRNQMMTTLGSLEGTLVKDPLSFRDELYELYHGTGWVKGLQVDRTSSADSVMAVMDAYNEAKNSDNNGIVGLTSPWPSWDQRSRGLQKGHLNIVVAKRATGKSQLSFVWMNHIWRNDLEPGDKILFVSMEMDSLMVKRRLFSIAAGLDYSKFNEGNLTEVQERRFYSFCNRLMDPVAHNDPEIIFMYCDQINSVRDIEVKAAEYKPKLIIIDGLYIIGRGSTKARWERTVDTVEELKLRLCINYPVIATHQLKGTTNENAMTADADEMAYAKAIGDYADVILGIFADDSHRRGFQRTVRTLKGRDFIPIDWRINFDLERQIYTEIDVIEKDEIPESTVKPPKLSSEYEVGGPVFGDGDDISL